MGVGIIWTLLLLSSTLSLRKFYQEDFDKWKFNITACEWFEL